MGGGRFSPLSHQSFLKHYTCFNHTTEVDVKTENIKIQRLLYKKLIGILKVFTN